MEDITIKFDDWVLNCRAGGIITHNNKILLHHNINEPYYALLGGRVKIGESSAETVKREIKEETGKSIEITGYISTVENFFELRDKKYHEYLFIHVAEFSDEQDKKIEETLSNVEGKEYLKYEWIDLAKIDEIDIRPVVIKQILKNGKFPVHLENIDL